MNDFLEFLYAHIPHRWLNKKAKGTKRLFEGLAKSISYLNGFVEMLQRNNQTRKSEELITELENEYGIVVNPSYDLDFRRERIIAKIRMQDSPITERQLVSILEMMGFFDVKITPLLGKFQVEIAMQIPQECAYKMDEVQKMLHENLRAHIGVNTRYVLPEMQATVAIGAFAQAAIYVHVLPYTPNKWETETEVYASSGICVGIYVEVK